MKLVRETLLEFHQTGDPIGSLNIGVSAHLKELIYHGNIIESSLKEMFKSDAFYNIAGNLTKKEIYLSHEPTILSNDAKYIRYEFVYFGITYHLGWNKLTDYYVGVGKKFGDSFLLDDELDGYIEINSPINKLLYWIELYYEKYC